MPVPPALTLKGAIRTDDRSQSTRLHGTTRERSPALERGRPPEWARKPESRECWRGLSRGHPAGAAPAAGPQDAQDPHDLGGWRDEKSPHESPAAPEREGR